MRKFLSLLFLISFFVSCTTVKLQIIEKDDQSLVMTSTEEPCFSEPKEKMRVVFSPEEGGRIHSISWEGKVVLEDVNEIYPSRENDFKSLSHRLLNDGSGLVIIDTKLAGVYQLRRSFSLVYDEEEDLHYLEVIYNVKNLAAEGVLQQKWEQSLLLNSAAKGSVSERQFTANLTGVSLTIFPVNLWDFHFQLQGNRLELGHKNMVELPHKERISWKILYIVND